MALELSWVSVTGWLLIGILTLITVWIWKTSQIFKTFKILGIPGPTPALLVGNMGHMIQQGIGVFSQWKKQYGNVYGIFLPTTPTLVIHDLDLIKEVMVKKFASFANRQPQPIFEFEPWKYNLLCLRDDNWKHVRSTLSPTFSSGKLKKVLPAIERVIQNLNANVQDHALNGEPVELKKYSACFAMDVLAGAAFGMHVDSIQNPNDPFVQNGLALMNQRFWLFGIAAMFPWFGKLLIKFGIYVIPPSATNFFTGVVDVALKERRQENKKYHDFLQLLVDAERENETQSAVQTQVDAEIDHGQYLKISKQWTRKGLTLGELHGNAVTFFLGGYDTVSTVMSFTLFSLAANPDCLKRAQAEVDEKLGKNAVSYETVHELTYIDMCMNEAMRLYPPGFMTDREAAEDMELGGYPIKKGMRMAIPSWAIHTDPDLWPDPLKFDPERHTPEARAARHPFSFMPFGMGPRNCIGMRLAQLEIRMAIASLLQNFSLSLCEKSVNPPRIQKLKMDAQDGLWVKFQPRSHVVSHCADV